MAARRTPGKSGQRLTVGLALFGVLVVFGFFGWALYASGGLAWTGGSKAIAIALVAGALGVGALTGVLMWLAFYSDRKGYDDPPTFEKPEERG
jgi:cation transporter-like permease